MARANVCVLRATHEVGIYVFGLPNEKGEFMLARTNKKPGCIGKVDDLKSVM
jgi:hypothetical protein